MIGKCTVFPVFGGKWIASFDVIIYIYMKPMDTSFSVIVVEHLYNLEMLDDVE